MRAIVWDDEPEGYITPLKKILEDRENQIQLHIEIEPNAFLIQLKQPWEFAIVDILDGGESEETGEPTGIGLARAAASKIPLIFLISSEEPTKFHNGTLPPNVVSVSKRWKPVFTADHILASLKYHKLLTDDVASEKPNPVISVTPMQRLQTDQPIDEDSIVMLLERLDMSDFVRVLVRIDKASHYVPDSGSHYERVDALMRYVRSGNGPNVDRLVTVLKELFPHSGLFM